MIRSRGTYLILIFFTIIIGLLSRHFTGIPLFIGDVLWALMVYFLFRFLFLSTRIRFVVTASLLFCYAIEFSQLYKAPWIENLRHTFLGHLILGSTFMWTDLICYTAGIIFGLLIDSWILTK